MKKRSRRKVRLEGALNASETPLFLLDRKRAIIFFNSGCEALTGWPAEEILGTICDYVSEPVTSSAEALASSLCPPLEVLDGKTTVVPAFLAHRDGGSLPRLLNFFPLAESDGRVRNILGIVTAIKQPAPPARITPAQKLHAELAALRHALRQRYGISTFVGNGAAIHRVLEQIQLARDSSSAVLMTGESGTGKEHVARLIHNETDARSQSFVPVDCRALPAREIKGILRRLFDVDDDTPSFPGLRPSTLFLNNVDSLPRDLQQTLVERFASDSPRPSPEIRLMAASTANMSERLAAEEIRSDFFFLLTTLEIALPPLQDRRDDTETLSQAFLEDQNRGGEKQLGGFTQEVMEQFGRYHWPGNLDELQAVITEAREACQGTLIDVKDLPFRFRTGLDAQAVGPKVVPRLLPLEEHLAAIEAEHIRSALDQVRHNKTQAAKLLGITRARLYRRMQTLNIEDHEEDRQ